MHKTQRNLSLTAFLFCAGLVVQPQTAPAQTVPTISHIMISAVSHASFNIQYKLASPGFVQVRYGVSSGSYTYSSVSYMVYGNGSDYNNVDVSISIGGLAPGTTYYVLPMARPNQDDDNGICKVASCGAVEQVITTAALPAVHPALPTPPNAWVPVEPQTANYTVVSMQVSPSKGECVAASNVAKQSGWRGAVTAGDNIGAILGKVGYGTVVEFPQGASCKVFQTDTYWHTGYVLPALPVDAVAGSMDSPNHRWIVFRTKTVAASDFPPSGVRTGPQWASKLAKLVAQTPGMPTRVGGTPNPGQQNFNGQIFDCYQSGCHHFWFENLEWTHLADATVYPAGATDPPAFTAFLRLVPDGLNLNNPATTPNYNVVDRVYAHVQPWPARQWASFVPGGNHWAIVNSYEVANIWIPGVSPTLNPTISGATLNIPKQFYQLNAFDNTPIGMTSSATATFTAPAGYTGGYIAWLDASGLTIDYATGPGVSLACSGCIAVSEASPSLGSVPVAAMYYFSGHLNNGTVVRDGSMPDNITPGVIPPWKPMAIYELPGNFGYIENNYFSAPGQTIYNDTDGAHTDQTWTHNYFYFPRSKMKNSGSWDGYGYTFRNVFETKQALRWRLEGNIFDGSAAYQNAGNAIYIAGSYAAPVWSTGTQDILIKNNLVKHVSSGFQCAGGGAQLPPDAPTAARIQIENNAWADLNRDLYNNGGGGFFSGAFQISPGCEDVTIHKNTVDRILGPGPSLLLIGAASSGATVMGEGLSVTNNIFHVSLNSLDVFWSQCGQNIASHPAYPAPVCSGGGTGTTYTQMLNNSFMQAGALITPSWTFTHNLIIGAFTKRAGGNWVDIDQGTMNSLEAALPKGNSFAKGNTLLARRTAAKWEASATTFGVKPTGLNSGDMGASIEDILNASGVVRNIVVNSGSASVQLSYQAPDARPCTVDFSGDGTTWARLSDTGGGVTRSIAIPGLSAGTAYQYRLMCYFDQSADYEFSADRVTTGTFTTATAAKRPVEIGFHLPNGAAKALITLSPPVGNPTVQTCSASPCTIPLEGGTYTRTTEYRTSSGALVGVRDVGRLSVR